MTAPAAPCDQLSRRRLLGGLVALGLGVPAAPAAAAPKALLWERWLAHNPSHGGDLDHGLWQTFLDRRLEPSPDGINRLDYARVSATETAALDRYLATLAGTAINRFSRATQRAYWINLYNALTVRLVLEHYPLASLRDLNLSPGIFARGPWGAKLVQVEGEELSLDDIEHRILRPIWRDSRLHYAVNCAALGCPNLTAETFTAANGERLLAEGARAFVNHRRGAEFTARGLVVSSLYRWYEEDFGGSDAAILAHLASHAGPALAGRLAAVRTIAGDRYDWRLNDVARET